MRQQSADERAEWFTQVRPILHTIADEILGSAARADDVLLCTWQHWMTTDLGDVDDVESHLAALAARQALETLRTDAEQWHELEGPGRGRRDPWSGPCGRAVLRARATV